ncbi:MAG: zinc-binding dehydrogenase [Pseudomonadales bacterium]|nr:zinc-binding dehydrogenase [Pseudomonadales bacterium]
MRQIEIQRSGTPSRLSLVEQETPTPQSGELLIQCRAAGINFADILIRKGVHPDSPEPPFVPGYEVSGVVVSTGAHVDPEWLGQEVIALTPHGGYADYLCVKENLVYKKPSELSFEAAAGIPVVYLTAWQCTKVMGSLNSDETILIHNAGGGFGLAALDLATDIGATVIGTASASKHQFLAERGIEHLIDYNQTNWAKEVMALTHGKGVELIIDPIGGIHWKTSYECLRNTGRLALFGISIALSAGKGRTLSLLKTAMQMPFYHPIALMNSNKGVFGVSMQNLWEEAEKSQRWMQQIMAKISSGQYRPHVDKVFSLEEAEQAHDYIEARQNTGKVVLSISH